MYTVRNVVLHSDPHSTRVCIYISERLGKNSGDKIHYGENKAVLKFQGEGVWVGCREIS